MSKKFDFEYIILGSGAAGRTAALRLAEGGKKVALITGPNFGGTELSPAAIGIESNFAFLTSFYQIRTSPLLKTDHLTLNFNELAKSTHKLVETSRSAWYDKLEMAGVTILSGSASLIDRHWVAIADKDNLITEVSAKTLILATGSRPKVAEISGLDKVDYLTPDAALGLDKPPKFILIVGGGKTGTELASHFAKLGVRVLIMEKLDQLLPREDKEVSEAVTRAFKEKLDIMVVTGAKVTRLEQDTFSKRVIFSSNNGEKVVRVDSIVLATGSEPVLDYSLEQAKVEYRRSGIVVDSRFNTSTKNIFAIGDAVDSPLYSTSLRSVLEGEVLAANLLKSRSVPPHALKGRGKKYTPNYPSLPRLIRAASEVAVIGMNERDLVSRDLEFQQIVLKSSDFRENSPFKLEKDGFVKLLLSSNNELLGASVVGTHADAIVAELSLSVAENLPLKSLISLGDAL